MHSTPSSPEAPIGLFDSGVGGLTVLRQIFARLPREHTVYLGDTARVPYGTRSGEVVTRYALQSGKHLAAHRIKLLVVACNTVSAQSLPALAAAMPMPVLGVIEPGARAAAAKSRGGTIAVLGTPATIASGAYQAALHRLAPSIKVVARACPLFVPLAEEGRIDGEVPRLVAERYLADLRRAGVDTVLLGCTHYPLLARAIAQVMGPEVAICRRRRGHRRGRRAAPRAARPRPPRGRDARAAPHALHRHARALPHRGRALPRPPPRERRVGRFGIWPRIARC